MKILVIAGTLSFEYHMGTTPMMWQLPKALHEVGNTVILSTYLGKAIESPWWKVYPNPLEKESHLYNLWLDKTSTRAIGHGNRLLSKASALAIKHYVNPSWHRHMLKMCEKEKPDAVLFIMVPFKHIEGIATEIRQKFNIPVASFDGDLPSSLNNSGSKMFKFDMYKDVDISEYDCIFSCSKGIIPSLMKLGARKAEVLYYAADQSIFNPISGVEKDIDVFYYGHRSAGKEKRFDYMMCNPSKIMTDKKFVIGGVEHNYDIGNCLPVGRLSLGEWRYWCARSRININITKDTDAAVYASSSARPFELAAMNCCIVSDQYTGMEEWFEPGKEIFTANEVGVMGLYKTLLSDAGLCDHVADNALKRVTREHTYKHRARQVINVLRSL